MSSELHFVALQLWIGAKALQLMLQLLESRQQIVDVERGFGCITTDAVAVEDTNFIMRIRARSMQHTSVVPNLLRRAVCDKIPLPQRLTLHCRLRWWPKYVRLDLPLPTDDNRPLTHRQLPVAAVG